MSLKFKYAPGGKVSGPSHNDGGVEAVNKEGTPVAEIEGGERVFSIEDTKEIEERAMEIEKEKDEDQKNIFAQALGHRIVEMLARQERINPSE